MAPVTRVCRQALIETWQQMCCQPLLERCFQVNFSTKRFTCFPLTIVNYHGCSKKMLLHSSSVCIVNERRRGTWHLAFWSLTVDVLVFPPTTSKTQSHTSSKAKSLLDRWFHSLKKGQAKSSEFLEVGHVFQTARTKDRVVWVLSAPDVQAIQAEAPDLAKDTFGNHVARGSADASDGRQMPGFGGRGGGTCNCGGALVGSWT